ncbi:uncharacterized protein [Diabrotica undecimpunctata]|uniref:uncharacterized protein n=1 Tax=Diabrotica undecimpunctata TaxID=50387 RepID=UPI003B63BCC4
MPTEYVGKGSVSRGKWSEDQLVQALTLIENREMGVNEASRHFQIPGATLRRRRKSRDFRKRELGPTSTLGINNQIKLVNHITKLQQHVCAPTRTMVRSMAFELAEKLKLKHKFNKDSRKAGYPWLESFLRRNKQLSVRKSEGVSAARALGMNKTDVSAYFTLLKNILNEHSLMNKPGSIYNIDETGLQLNNMPEHVIAIKGSKNVASVTSAEKGETI